SPWCQAGPRSSPSPYTISPDVPSGPITDRGTTARSRTGTILRTIVSYIERSRSSTPRTAICRLLPCPTHHTSTDRPWDERHERPHHALGEPRRIDRHRSRSIGRLLPRRRRPVVQAEGHSYRRRVVRHAHVE